MPGPREVALAVLFVVERDSLLELDARRQIYEATLDYPGLHLRELARQVGVDPNHAKYHLQRLQKHGLVTERREEGYVRYFGKREGPLGAHGIGASDKAVLAFLRRPLPLQLVLTILDGGPASASTLAERVGVARTTVDYHLRRMGRAELLASRKYGRETLYEVPDEDALMQVLMTYRPPDALVQGFLETWESLGLDA